MRFLLSCALCWMCFSIGMMAQPYRTEALVSEIQTIRIHANGDWQNFPVMNLHSDETMVLTFDRLAENTYDRLRYKIIHCNADWRPSSLSGVEYLDGFNDNLIEDYSYSINTTTNYTNYWLELPNEDVEFKLSGNYVILVYEEDNPQNELLTACFSIVNPEVGLSGSYTSNTLIDSNREHHQIAFTIDQADLNIRDPFEDLKVFVFQNGRLDNAKRYVKPTSVQPNKLVYDYSRELIFEAGNEYRRFETVSYRYNGYRVLFMEYVRPYYHAHIIPDRIRANTRYIYDQDQNGKFFIRNAEVNDQDSNVEADYFLVKFTLQAERPFVENIYINGDFTNNSFSDRYLMQYDYQRDEYFVSLLLKQGVYNYQYLAETPSGFSTAQVEGNYFETDNMYRVFVYYRPPGQRYDSLIGVLAITKEVYMPNRQLKMDN